ncbi:MAG: hypothetical protein ABSH19_08880 [Opitutales bacterium]
MDVIRGVLETAQHGRVFERESLILAASHRLAIVRPEAMVQIDLLSGEALDAVTFDPALYLFSAQELSAETWQKAQVVLVLMSRGREGPGGARALRIADAARSGAAPVLAGFFQNS